MIKRDLSQGCKDFFNICKSICLIHHFNKLNGKYMILTIDAEKSFDKIQHTVSPLNTDEFHFKSMFVSPVCS